VNETDQKPAALGYRMPAEWEPHSATWIAWPHNHDDWPGKFSPIRWVYTEIVRHLSRVEPVHIVVAGSAMRKRISNQLDAVGVDPRAVRFFKAATDRSWLRDTGPTFVVNDNPTADGHHRLGLVDWRFNGWAKYDNYKSDNGLPGRIARWLERPRWVPRIDDKPAGRPRVVMEGGAIDVNGRGTLLATEE
jgi:agmatine deiminase